MKDLELRDDPDDRGAFFHARDNGPGVHLRIGHHGKSMGIILSAEEVGELYSWLDEWLYKND